MRLLFIDGTKGFTPTRLKDKACGGILGSLTIIPRYLASKGHEVFVMSNYEKDEVIDGVRYIPNGTPIPKWDITVFNRNLINKELVGYSKHIGAKTVWWLHDIVDFRYLDDGAYKVVDKVIALSEYCKESFSEFYSIDSSKFVVIPNGVDKSVFYPGDYSERVPHRYIMASALIKGFIPIEVTWNNLQRQFPKAELRIYSSQGLHDFEDNPQQKAWLDMMTQLGAKVWNPVPQHVLADVMRRSWGLLMPNHYPEICSNLLLQARACGLLVITSNIGSASEFIENGRTGIITERIPSDLHLWIYHYAKAVVQLSKNPDKHKAISEAAPEGVQDWDTIGERWENEFKKLLASA